MKLLFGSLLGLMVCLVLLFIERQVINPYYTLTIPAFIADTTKSRPDHPAFIEIKNQYLNLEERLASVNKRIDDVLIFGGIIVALLLAINAGVFIKGQREVDKHLKENFGVHKEEIMQHVNQARKMTSVIRENLNDIQSKQIESHKNLSNDSNDGKS